MAALPVMALIRRSPQEAVAVLQYLLASPRRFACLSSLV
jgi:hypothetical protein